MKSLALYSLVFFLLTLGCAHTQSQTLPVVPKLQFSAEQEAKKLHFIWNSPTDPYLTKLRREYKLDELLENQHTDLEKVQLLSAWVKSRWIDNGFNEPVSPDPISLLEAAAKGERFRGVESSIVMSGVLNAVGIPARIVGLMKANAETAATWSGHVVTEAYLRDKKAWVMIDPQSDAIPTLSGNPISTVVLQNALAAGAKDLNILSLNRTKSTDYFEMIAPYLYYFDTQLDTRFRSGHAPYSKHSNALMLVPIGAPEPKVFQRKWALKNMIYTHSVEAFYPTPEN